MEDSEFKKKVKLLSPLMKDHRLASLVNYFQSVIASKYRSSLIESFEDLVALLIKRDYIDPTIRSTWPLLFDRCSQYLSRSPNIPPSAPDQLSSNAGLPLRSHSTDSSQSLAQLHPQAVEYLSTSLGIYSWTHFARALGLGNGNVDSIEIKHEGNAPACVREVLRIYTEEMTWKWSKGSLSENIVNALHRINRKGLIWDFKQLMASTETQDRKLRHE